MCQTDGEAFNRSRGRRRFWSARSGSRLHLLGRAPDREREALAGQYVAEALADEDVTVTGTELTREAGGAVLTVWLDWRGEELHLTVKVGEME